MAGSAFVSGWKGNVLVVNRKCLEVLEYDTSEMIGENWFDMCIPLKLMPK
jgi:PAS domain-containing protein